MHDRNGIRRFAPVLALALSFAVATSVATAARPGSDKPLRFNARSLDGTLVTAVSPLDGSTWSAWAYRDGGQYDIAVSSRVDGGFWTEPVFFGRASDRDQVQPSLAFDASGHLYLAFADRGTGAIVVTALPAGGQAWLDPFVVTSDGERGHMPTLRVVSDRLVIGYRSGIAVEIRDLPLLPPGFAGRGVKDGPDPFGANRDSGSGGGGGSGGSGGEEVPAGSATGGVWSEIPSEPQEQ